MTVRVRLGRDVKFLRYFGRVCVMVKWINEGDRYGRIGSSGRTLLVTVWRDPR